MGKEWLYYLGGGSRTSKRGKTSSSSEREMRDISTSTSTSTNSTTSAGCMNSLFQLFDFHHPFHFPNLHHQPSFQPPDSFLIPQEPLIIPPLKGAEAPRNSLEMEHTSFMEAATLSSSSTMEKLGMQIKTSSSRSSRTYHDLSSSECSSSSPAAGTKTPTLVARLMGLDLLPENSSPRPSSSSSSNHYSSFNHPSSSKSHVHRQQVQNSPKNNKKSIHSSEMINDVVMTGCRSLPETPRISSARKSDVDQRFSLQIIKENININNELATCQEFDFSKFLATKIAADQDENMSSPGHYAKQIVKQFKESVSRRVGRDITNTVNNGGTDEQRRDQHIVLLKSKKPSNIGVCHDQSAIPNSCSPRLRFLDTTKINKPTVIKNNQTCHSPKLSLSPCTNINQSKGATVFSPKPKAQAVPGKELEKQHKQQINSSIQNCRKIAKDKYGPRLTKPPQQEESFVRPSSTNRAAQISDKKCKKIPLSNHVPALLSVKKDSSPPATRLLQKKEVQKQSQACDALPRLSRSLSQSYKLYESITVQDDINSDGTTTAVRSSCSTEGELIEYISRILKCTGIREFTPLSLTKWYSPSHPLDPSIYHHLEISFPELNIYGYHKKLIFELVDELLVDILRPYMHVKPWICGFWVAGGRILDGSQLIKSLCGRIGSFPSADCRVLEDIDSLIEDKDLGLGLGLGQKQRSFEEEAGDEIVAEVEGDILERLLHETAAMVVFGVRTE